MEHHREQSPVYLRKGESGYGEECVGTRTRNRPSCPMKSLVKFYRAIAEYAPALKSGGALYFEINPIYEKETREMLEGLYFKAIDTKEDAFGKQRMMQLQFIKFNVQISKFKVKLSCSNLKIKV